MPYGRKPGPAAHMGLIGMLPFKKRFRITYRGSLRENITASPQDVLARKSRNEDTMPTHTRAPPNGSASGVQVS
ncbi:hypothetical protein DCM91_11965 [Chitinophaga costaii]|nr:hypothetical protein DCM91_11965 [Chitinophaga costaii]